MTTELINHLRTLADRYEREQFLEGDPSWFMHQVQGNEGKELLAFIASSISYGSRKQFMPRIDMILESSRQEGICKWLKERKFNDIIPPTEDCFYRLYTNKAFNTFLESTAIMIDTFGSIKAYIATNSHDHDAMTALQLLTSWYEEHGSGGVIPRNTSSSCKRLCMFLRWMVRDDSPVDIGLWSDIIDKRTLIIPMDTHVIEEASKLHLITSKSTSMSNAVKLTKALREAFPDDPVKADFALFGIGVDTNETSQ